VKNYVTMRKAVLLLGSSLTIMAGATVAPSLPRMSEFFAGTPNVEILTRLMLTGHALFVAIFSPIIGLCIDRFGRKRVLLGSLALYACAGSTGLLLDSLASLLVGRAFLGIAVAGTMTACTTLIGDYYSGRERIALLGMQGAFMAFGGVMFVSAGGFLADMSWRAPFLIYLSALLILPGAFVSLYEPRLPSRTLEGYTRESTPALLIVFIYLVGFFGMVMIFMIPVQLPFYLKQMAPVNSSKVGLAIGTSILAAGISSVNYGRFKRILSFRGIFALSFLLFGFGFTVLSTAENYTMVLIAMVITGSGNGLIMPNGALWTVTVTPAHLRGRMVGGLTTVVSLGQFFSPILMQPVVSMTSISRSYLMAGVLMLLLAGGLMTAGFAVQRRQ
jgi:MFS family permease